LPEVILEKLIVTERAYPSLVRKTK